jgi:hypothetical protein
MKTDLGVSVGVAPPERKGNQLPVGGPVDCPVDCPVDPAKALGKGERRVGNRRAGMGHFMTVRKA